MKKEILRYLKEKPNYNCITIESLDWGIAIVYNNGLIDEFEQKGYHMIVTYKTSDKLAFKSEFGLDKILIKNKRSINKNKKEITESYQIEEKEFRKWLNDYYIDMYWLDYTNFIDLFKSEEELIMRDITIEYENEYLLDKIFEEKEKK